MVLNKYKRLAKDLAQIALTATCDETAQDFMIKAGVPQNDIGRFIFNLTVANSIICIFAINLSVKFNKNIGQKILDQFLEILMKNLNDSETIKVGHGEVIDTEGDMSTQLDAIITNEYHPFVSELTNPTLFFIEGVFATGEVKSILNSTDLDSILKNCQRFKELKIKMPKGAEIKSNLSDINRFVDKRAYFLFAFESQMTLDTILNKVQTFNKEYNLPINKQIDAIFTLDRGCVFNFGDGKGTFQFRTSSGESIPGLLPKPIENDPKVLFNFLSWISSLPQKAIIHDNILTYYLMKGQGV